MLRGAGQLTAIRNAGALGHKAACALAVNLYGKMTAQPQLPWRSQSDNIAHRALRRFKSFHPAPVDWAPCHRVGSLFDAGGGLL